jgi:single-strand selective monofunctional uracil DNA glycosylase
MKSVAKKLIQAAKTLRTNLDSLQFKTPVKFVYNPLHYAWQAHAMYLERFANSPCRTFFLGMNPGPWGMAQTGVPFGEIGAVRDYLGIEAKIDKPAIEHPKRRIEGFACSRSEVSGKRLWGLMAERFPAPKDFFASHFVANYCPLVFMDEGARNITPDKLSVSESLSLDTHCDVHLRTMLSLIQPEFAIGIGAYAQACLVRACAAEPSLQHITINKILHPSPASPAANKDWAGQATKQLKSAGVW